MQLTVPQRTVADTGSFPVNPDGVAHWLASLRPLESEADAREIYRGLKHSNRLHNDLQQRRAVLSCFIPVLRELYVHLADMTQAQPLPLSREFFRNARLAESLLREEAFSFKILLSDSQPPLADDARRAMQALARQTEALAHAYRPVPTALIKDAHQLYALADKHQLLSAGQNRDLPSLQDHYRFILLVCIADLAQQRVRQLPLLLGFIKTCVPDIQIEQPGEAVGSGINHYAVNLELGSRPEPKLSLPGGSATHLRCFSVARVLQRIDSYSARISTKSSGVPGNDMLERQSLARLRMALARTRRRRSARRITSISQRVVFGHKEVCAHLLYRPADTPSNEASGWIVTNLSLQGICIQNNLCRPGLVQVGELISVTEPNTALRSPSAAESSKIEASLGIIRWVQAQGETGICMGIEFIARSVLPVRVLRDEIDPANEAKTVSVSDITADDIARDIGVGENALIVACKVQHSVLQTMLMPPYLYQPGDRLTATQGGRSRKVQLDKNLQSNGLFSQYSLVDSSTSG
mgnify:CR=1 FL=1